MSAKKAKPKKMIFRFYGHYNNIAIGPKIKLNGVKIILHEVAALNVNEAFELYKYHLIHNVGISEVNLQQYLIDLYYKSIMVEIVDGDTTSFDEIGLIA